MKRTATVIGAVLMSASLSLAADTGKGSFRFGKVHFEPVDAIAWQEPIKDGKPLTIVALTSFKIDRPAVMDAIDTASALIGQASGIETGDVVFVRALSAEKCGASAFLTQTQQQIDLSDSFSTKSVSLTATRAAGECFTSKPGKMFDDEYEFRLPYDIPLTTIPKPTTLLPGGGEPGTAYVALVNAIKAADWNAAHLHLRPDEMPRTKPKASEMREYFNGLALNYPKAATVTGGLLKGNRANLDIQGTNNEGKKIKGVVAMKKTAGEWQVIDQSFYFTE